MKWLKKYFIYIAGVFVVGGLILNATVPIILEIALLEIKNIPSSIKQSINHTYEDLNMPTYQSAEFEWGMSLTAYQLGTVDPVVRLEAFPYANRMSDAAGKDVARVLFSGAPEWGATI